MKRNVPHLSEEDLILLADGEVSSREAERLEVHLAACRQCDERRIALEGKLAQIADAYKHARPTPWDASGPRALLKARLAGDQVNVMRRSWPGTFSSMRAIAYAGALALIFVGGFEYARSRSTGDTSKFALQLPDRRFTPGLVRDASLTEVCTSAGEETVRQVPPYLQQQVLREYGINPEASDKYEIDYLITPGLGGADDVKNLWPEPHANTPWNSFAKDKLEDHLHRMVCNRKISLEQAQRDISQDWIAAYKKYYQAG